MVLLLTAEELAGILSFEEAIDAAERGYRDWANDEQLCEPRHRVYGPDGVRVTVHQGSSPTAGGAGLAVQAEHLRIDPDNHQRYAMLGSPVRVSYSSKTAELEAIIIGELRTQEFPGTYAVFGMATAAVSMLGTKLLAKDHSPVLGVLGSGTQARLHAAAACAVRDISHIKVYSPTRENRELFAEEVSTALGTPVEPLDNARAVVGDSDIVMCTTNTNTPVLDGEWLRPGTHVLSLVTGDIGLKTRGHTTSKRRELDDATLRRADIIGTNSLRQVESDQGADLFDSREAGVFPANRLVDLGQLMRGEHPGRSHESEITVFKNSALYGSADQALTRLLVDKARTLGIGSEISTSKGEARE